MKKKKKHTHTGECHGKVGIKFSKWKEANDNDSHNQCDGLYLAYRYWMAATKRIEKREQTNKTMKYKRKRMTANGDSSQGTQWRRRWILLKIARGYLCCEHWKSKVFFLFVWKKMRLSVRIRSGIYVVGIHASYSKSIDLCTIGAACRSRTSAQNIFDSTTAFAYGFTRRVCHCFDESKEERVGSFVGATFERRYVCVFGPNTRAETALFLRWMT